MRESNSSKAMLAAAMVIFGTIGIFRKYIPLPSGVLAMARGVIGAAFLFFIVKLGGGRISRRSVKNNIAALIASGAVLGINWILLFEAYSYTSVATATLAYYMAPVIVILVSPVLFGEKLTVRKIICVVLAVLGMVLVSGVLTSDGEIQTKGIVLGLCAAVFYALVMIINRYIHGMSADDKTIVQLLVAAAVLLPYTLLTGELATVQFTFMSAVMLVVVGVIHTGVAYRLYFGAMADVKSTTVALYSYIDPALAVVLSATVMGDAMGLAEILGAVLVLGATMASEITPKKKNRYF